MIKKWFGPKKTMLRPAVVVSEQSGLIERNETQHLREHLCCGSCVSSPGQFLVTESKPKRPPVKNTTGTVLRMSTDGVSRKGSPHAFLDQTDGMHFEHFLNGKFEELRKTFSFWFSGQASF